MNFTSCEPTVMMSPAAATPANIDMNACFLLMSNNAATRAPVHAPVPGRGIATNTKSPHAAYFSIFERFFSAFSYIAFDILENNFIEQPRIHFNTALTQKSITGTGRQFPIILTINVVCQGSPIPVPIGIAPRSSIRGTMDTSSNMRYLSNMFKRFSFLSFVVSRDIIP